MINTKYQIKKGLLVQKIGEKTTIFDGDKSYLYTFNDTASFIFSKLKSKLTKEEIIYELMKKYQVDKKEAIKDLNVLIKDLLTKKIIIKKKK